MTDAIAQLQATLDRLIDGKHIERILEAGCGSTRRIRIAPDAVLVGIDISEKQLQRNGALDERILGDIQAYALRESHFDVIVCWDVLEHLSQPEQALANFVRAVKEEGLVVLALPNLRSMKGLLTKFTPFWFHVWTRRRLFGETQAGTEDFGPFPTYLRPSIAPAAILRFARERDLVIEYFQVYESDMHRVFRERHRTLGLVWRGLAMAAQAVSLGRISADLTDCFIVLRKAKPRA